MAFIKDRNIALGAFLAVGGLSTNYLGFDFLVLLSIGLKFSSSVFSSIATAISVVLSGLFIIKHLHRIPRGIIFYAIITFLLLYGLRVLYEVAIGTSYHLNSPGKISAYFFANAIIPFLLGCVLINRAELVSRNFFFFGVAICLSALIFYGELLGVVGQLGDHLTADIIFDETASPLLISYAAAVTLILGVNFFIKSTRISSRALYFGSFGLSIATLLLGSSRGAFVALTLIASIALTRRYRDVSGSVFLIGLSLVSIIVAVVGLFEWEPSVRQLNTIANAMTSGRVDLYLTSIEQVRGSELFGSGLENTTYNHFPHNIFIEAYLATGVLSAISFCVVILILLMRAVLLIRRGGEQSWVGALFILYFVHAFFNASIYLADAFWLISGMLIGVGSASPSRLRWRSN